MDAIHTIPINSTAAKVVSKGFSEKYVHKHQCLHSNIMIPTINKPVTQGEDLSGFEVGRLTVIGIAKLNEKKKRKWVVRCLCGNYETRSAKSIKNKENFKDRCYECKVRFYEKRNYMYRVHGIDLPDKEIDD
jgi:hypothetical protein